ncbi:helix-turn-helix family protein [Mycobacterium xenopi 4042]|uniref:Helix-turn-helix family protein n=1 Tax=Mycobacterium xenopi 4042 TaxID=1299334 RepID=X7YRC9_MYCXE|nr:helix-turn-helix family protein [Mycobacterium xenopi 4042]
MSDLARMADVAVSTIHHWEAGTRSPQIDILANVMKVLHAPIESVVLIPTDHRYPSDWRAIKGLTQPQLAAAAHMPTATIQRIERPTTRSRTKRADHRLRSWHQRRGVQSRIPTGRKSLLAPHHDPINPPEPSTIHHALRCPTNDASTTVPPRHRLLPT